VDASIFCPFAQDTTRVRVYEMHHPAGRAIHNLVRVGVSRRNATRAALDLPAGAWALEKKCMHLPSLI
jgi:hypothetical protein